MLPTSTTSATKTIPSYLYWQYQNDPDIAAFVTVYNQDTQSIVNWFNSVNLPIYTQLSGNLLDWVGQGVYGYPRPIIGSSKVLEIKGQINSYPTTVLPISSAYELLSQTTYTIPDGIYQRMLTWFFYKGDGEIFSPRLAFCRKLGRYLPLIAY